jgi:RNA 3'-terminal phosphate cyclase (ATP)
MKATVKWKDGMNFEATGVSNHAVSMDAAEEVGGKNLGPRPIELLLFGLGGCTGMDVISILRKMRKEVTSFEMEIEADRSEDHPKVFTHIRVKYILKGEGKIDGSYGEGGGQILRTSLSLSMVTGQPFEILDIRKGRKKPGLQPQHLTCVRAAKQIASAEVRGDELGSTSLTFQPHSVKAGQYHFNVAEERGSAGSSSLVLQAILLPLSFGKEESKVTIEGGTHVAWSPPFHYMNQVFSPLLSPLGFSFSFHIEKWGWYPKGGGVIQVTIAPYKKQQKCLELHERGALKEIQGLSVVSHLPLSIAERQRKEAGKILSSRNLKVNMQLEEAPSLGAGTFLFLHTMFENSAAGFSALGKRGKRAEEVGREAAQELLLFLDSGAALDPHSADQLIPYLASIGGKHVFSTSFITQHLLTNIWVVRKFFPHRHFQVDGKSGEPGKITLSDN